MALTDDFNRADGGLGSNWTTDQGTAPTISSNVVGTSDVGYAIAHWSANSWNNDQSAQITKTTTNHYVGPVVRANGNNWYFWHSAGEIQKSVAGVTSTIGTTGAVTGTGQTMKLTITGTTLEMFIDGVSQGTVTDSDLSSGSAGIGFYSTSGRLDNWEGTGETGGGGPSPNRSNLLLLGCG